MARVEPLYREAEPEPPPNSDDELALHFARDRGDDWRHVSGWGTWLYWNKSRWEKDQTLMAQEEVRMVCRIASNDAFDKSGNRGRIASAKKIGDVLKLVRSDRLIAATVDQWDKNPWVLNTPDGTWDLQRGDLRRHDRLDYLTKITAASADGSKCTTWCAFLDRVTGGDLELQAYLQRMTGYMLTGSTEEHALFFLYGVGANGKSVFINTLAGILGDYHTTSPIEVFMASQNDRHPTELAMLRGARLVTAVETEEGRAWAESKIKTLTGGDRISARFMRQDFFEFTPAFKLLIAGNHRPRLRSVDEAIRRRFNLIPFTVTIPPAERDPQLGEKLKAEWPAILTWAIEGFMDWRREGLSPPTAVREATAAYFESQDAVAAWLAEGCTIDANARTSRAVLWKSWEDWTKRTGERAGSAKAFYEVLEKRGFQPIVRRGERGFLGLAIAGVQDGAASKDYL